MATLKIVVPASLASVEAEIKTFIDAMVFKLAKNAHKGKWETFGLQETIVKLQAERQELEDAIAAGNCIEIILEAADVANFALIAASIAIRDAAKEAQHAT